MPQKFKAGIHCTRLKREAFYSMRSSHSHTFHEIYYLMSGQRKLVMNQTIYELNRGDLAIIPLNTIHRTSYLASSPHERIAVNFEDYVLEPLWKTPGIDQEKLKKLMEPSIIHIPESHRDYAEELLLKIIYENDSTDVFSNGLSRCYLLEFLLLLFRLKEASVLQLRPIDISNESIQSAVSYIYEHYYDDLTLTDIAAHLGMSSSYFSRKFKAVTGFGFKEYLTSVRIQKASEYLLKSDWNITEIALQCGFNDSNYFGDAFRKLKGVSPSKFRKNKGFV